MFRSEKHNVFSEGVSKIALSANGDKRIHSFLISIQVNWVEAQYA